MEVRMMPFWHARVHSHGLGAVRTPSFTVATDSTAALNLHHPWRAGLWTLVVHFIAVDLFAVDFIAVDKFIF